MKKKETLWIWSLPPDVPYNHLELYCFNADKNKLVKWILKKIAKPVGIKYMTVAYPTSGKDIRKND